MIETNKRINISTLTQCVVFLRKHSPLQQYLAAITYSFNDYTPLRSLLKGLTMRERLI
jgi:hypothetical protein